jgi:hypothetical protein
VFFAFVLDFDAPGAYNLGVRGVSVGLSISPSLRVYFLKLEALGQSAVQRVVVVR